MLRYCTFSCTCTHTLCYATVCSFAFPHIRHATRLYVLLHFHTYVMLGYCTFSRISTHTSCYATVRSPAFPHICDAMLLYVPLHFHTYHATLLYVLLHFHTYVMLGYCTFSRISTHTSCYATVQPVVGYDEKLHVSLQAIYIYNLLGKLPKN